MKDVCLCMRIVILLFSEMVKTLPPLIAVVCFGSRQTEKHTYTHTHEFSSLKLLSVCASMDPCLMLILLTLSPWRRYQIGRFNYLRNRERFRNRFRLSELGFLMDRRRG